MILPKAPCVFSAPISHHPPDWSWRFPRHLPWSFGRKPRPCQKPNHPCISRSPGGTTTWKWWLQELVFFFKASEASWMSPFSSFIASWNSNSSPNSPNWGSANQSNDTLKGRPLCSACAHIEVHDRDLPCSSQYYVALYTCPWDTKQQQNCIKCHPWPWCWGQLNGHLGKDLSWSWRGRSWPSRKIPKKGATSKVLRIVLGSLDTQVTRVRHLLASRVSESNIVTQFTLHLQARQADRVFESVTNQMCRNSRLNVPEQSVGHQNNYASAHWTPNGVFESAARGRGWHADMSTSLVGVPVILQSHLRID